MVRDLLGLSTPAKKEECLDGKRIPANGPSALNIEALNRYYEEQRRVGHIFYRSTDADDFQGPFTEQAIQEWYRLGYFHSGIQFRFGENGDIVSLATLRTMNGNACPFAFSPEVSMESCKNAEQKRMDLLAEKLTTKFSELMADNIEKIKASLPVQQKLQSAERTMQTFCVALNGLKGENVRLNQELSSLREAHDEIKGEITEPRGNVLDLQKDFNVNTHPMVIALIRRNPNLASDQRATAEDWEKLKEAYAYYARSKVRKTTHHLFEYVGLCEICPKGNWISDISSLMHHVLWTQHRPYGASYQVSREVVWFWIDTCRASVLEFFSS